MTQEKATKTPKTATTRVALSGIRIDDVLAGGGEYVICREGAGEIAYSPLVPIPGEPVSIRAQYRCQRCPQAVGHTVEYAAEDSGDVVTLFIGRDGEGGSRHTFLDPDLGSEPIAACSAHGPLVVARVELAAHVQRSRDLQARRGRKNIKERTTLARRLPPSASTRPA